jgi:hypothetical protein
MAARSLMCVKAGSLMNEILAERSLLTAIGNGASALL